MVVIWWDARTVVRCLIEDVRSEEELIADAIRGSPQAATELFERHWPRAWQVAYTLVGSRAAAEDVAAESFEAAFASLPGFNGRSSFATWLHRIVVNRALNTVRRERRLVPAGVDAVGDERQAGDTPTVDADPAVVAAVASLSNERRTVVVFRYWLDLSPAEIAEILQLPVGTVHSRLARALAELRSLVTEEEANHG